MTRRILHITIMLLLVALQSSYAQTITVRVDKAGKPSIKEVFLKLYDSSAQLPILSKSFSSDSGTVVQLKRCPCILEIEAADYEPLIQTLLPDSKLTEIVYNPRSRKYALDNLVVTGVTHPVRAQDALSLYQTISTRQITAMGAVTLADAVPFQLNMSTSNDAILGTGIRMQGLSGDKVKILMDGMPVNGRENGNIDLGQINLNNVESIEIIQGPMSIMYGSDALGGVINVISKKHSKPKELSVRTYYQSVGQYNINLNAARTIGRHNFSVGAGRNFFDGAVYTDTVAPHRESLFKPKEQYFGNVGYAYDAATSDFKLRFYSDNLREKVTNKGEASIDPFRARCYDDYYRTNRSINRLALSGKLAGGKWQSLNSYSYYQHVKNSYLKDLVSLEEVALTETGAQDTSIFEEWNSRSAYNRAVGSFEFTVGYDVDVQIANSQRINTGTKNIVDIAGFGMLSKYLWNKKLRAEVGIRRSYNSMFASPTLFSANLLYKPEASWQFRASYAKGYRAPSLKEMYMSFYDQNHNITGSDSVKPEKGHHVQLSMSHQFYQSGSNYMQLVAIGYYNDISDEIVLINRYPSNPNSIVYYYGNLKREKNTILNIKLDGQYRDLHFAAGASVNHTFEQAGGYDAFNALELNASAQYFLKPLGTYINTFYKFTGKQPFLSADISGIARYSGTAPSYNMLDMSLERRFWKRKLQIVAGVKNILNIQTLTAAGFVQSTVHSGNGSINFLPRRIFTGVNLDL